MKLGIDCKLKTNKLSFFKNLLSFQNEHNLNESLSVSAINSNPKFFYTYAKNNAKIKANIGPLIITYVITIAARCCANNTMEFIANKTRTDIYNHQAVQTLILNARI